MDFSIERWDKIKDDYRKWWAGELDRPLINVPIWGRDPGRSEPELPSHGFTAFYGDDVPAEEIVDRWLYNLECRYFPGDSFPNVRANFGPGVLAAFLGLTLQSRKDGNTVWFHPETVSEIADIHLTFDPKNRWFLRVADICRTAVERFDGLVQVNTTDLGGSLDILSSFRPGTLLPMDLYDSPEEVERLVWEVHEMWWRYFEVFDEKILQPSNPGYTTWTPIYSEKPYYMLQCDFCYMIGSDMFDKFVKPELAAMCKRLTNPFYHLDGPGQLLHLDSLLEIPELKGVQWVPGAGQPGITKWPEVYQKIHNAGKLIQIWPEEGGNEFASLDIIADQIGTANGIIMIGGVGLEREKELKDCLEKYGAA